MATLILFAQYHINSHSHENYDANIAHECTLCAVADHQDDTDCSLQTNSTDIYTWVYDPLEHGPNPTSLYLIRVSARAPPLA